MSKTIDERVVEMRFDNKQFENNVCIIWKDFDRFAYADYERWN